MREGRLPTELWVSAGLRRCSDEGVPATVVRKGEAQSGTVILKLNQHAQGCRVLNQTRDIDGRLVWFAALDGALVPEDDADGYIARSVRRDPDIWVVEVEHAEGWHPFDGRMMTK
jgi:hypothetical protein